MTLITVTYIRLKKLWISYVGTSGDSNDTPQLSAEGFSGRVMLIVSAVIQLLVWTFAFMVVAHRILGLFISYIDYIRLHLKLCVGIRKPKLYTVLFMVYLLVIFNK